MVAEKISIVIPAYNEEEMIVDTLNITVQVLKDLRYDYEILVVDDGSIDNTYNRVAAYSKGQDKIKVLRYEENKGKGFALRYGSSLACGQYIFFMDADLDISPKNIAIFLESLKSNQADVIAGCKRDKVSMKQFRMKRKIFSSSYYYITKLFFRLPVTETQTGFKLFKSEAIKSVIDKLSINKFAFDLELIIRLQNAGYKIIEQKVEVNPSRKKGRIKVKDAFLVLLDTIKIFMRFYLTRIYKKSN